MLENWNDYQIAHLRGLQEPQEDESGRGETRSPTTALTPRRAREAHSEESTVPREAHSATEPRHLSTDAQTQARSFPDTGQARPPPGCPCPCAERTLSSVNVLTLQSMRSHLNITSVDRTSKAKVLVARSCPTVCDPMDCSSLQPPLSMGFPRQIYQRVAIPFSKGSS